MNSPTLILASSSPRRRQLLTQVGLEFTVEPPDVEEIQREGEAPVDFVRRLSLEKANAVAANHESGLVLGSDTIVVLGGEILGKPESAEDAFAMLSQLSGNQHTVYTGFSIVDASTGESITDLGEAEVTFRELEESEIWDYIATGSPMDKAGSYGIQDDMGAIFVERINGDYYTVVGLPLMKVYLALRSQRETNLHL
ncbi:MAG: Maf family protein [Candidatus Kapaibacterium sp.]